LTDDPTTTALETLDAGVIACKGIRSTSEFPRDLAGLSAEQIAHHYGAMRNSHASLVRARGQLQRRSRELREARDSFLARLHGYEQRLARIGSEGPAPSHRAHRRPAGSTPGGHGAAPQPAPQPAGGAAS